MKIEIDINSFEDLKDYVRNYVIFDDIYQFRYVYDHQQNEFLQKFEEKFKNKEYMRKILIDLLYDYRDKNLIEYIEEHNNLLDVSMVDFSNEEDIKFVFLKEGGKTVEDLKFFDKNPLFEGAEEASYFDRDVVLCDIADFCLL